MRMARRAGAKVVKQGGMGGRAGRAFQDLDGNTEVRMGTWWTQPDSRGPAGTGLSSERIPRPASVCVCPSHRQLAGDGEGVAPLQGPILLPLSACNGPSRLLCGDPVPGMR